MGVWYRSTTLKYTHICSEPVSSVSSRKKRERRCVCLHFATAYFLDKSAAYSRDRETTWRRSAQVVCKQKPRSLRVLMTHAAYCKNTRLMTKRASRRVDHVDHQREYDDIGIIVMLSTHPMMSQEQKEEVEASFVIVCRSFCLTGDAFA